MVLFAFLFVFVIYFAIAFYLTYRHTQERRGNNVHLYASALTDNAAPPPWTWTANASCCQPACKPMPKSGWASER